MIYVFLPTLLLILLSTYIVYGYVTFWAFWPFLGLAELWLLTLTFNQPIEYFWIVRLNWSWTLSIVNLTNHFYYIEPFADLSPKIWSLPPFLWLFSFQVKHLYASIFYFLFTYMPNIAHIIAVTGVAVPLISKGIYL